MKCLQLLLWPCGASYASPPGFTLELASGKTLGRARPRASLASARGCTTQAGETPAQGPRRDEARDGRLRSARFKIARVP